MDKKELIEIINMVLDARESKKEPITPQGKLRSDQLDKYAEALSGMQSEYNSVIANRTNPFFKSRYADLDAALKSVRPLFKKYGFSLDQHEEEWDDKKYLRTMLLHKSGQYSSSFVKIIFEENPKNNKKSKIQDYGSALSYHKRYSACTILGITIDNDPDDNDGEPNRYQSSNVREENNQSRVQDQKHTQLLTEGEIEYINESLKDHDDIKEDLLRTLKVDKVEDCPKRLFDTIVLFIDSKIDKKIKKESSF